MQRLLLLFIFSYAIVGINTSSAQGSAEFYFPLRVGNYWAYHTDGLQTPWSSRTTRETIDGTDLIAGQQYVRVKGVEILDSNTSDTLIFHVFWLRQDPTGNILLGAVSGNAADIDSAIRIDPPMPFFPNEFLNAGYSREYFDPTQNIYALDSVESTAETVNTSAGSFTDCIKIRNQQKDPQGVIVFLEHAYYARGVGEVKRTRDIPVSEVHVNHLVQYNTETSIEGGQTQVIPNGFALWQNYPNPFNPTTSIRFSVPTQSGRDGQVSGVSDVRLSVYDLLGREVAVLVNERKAAGSFEVSFDASALASGLYIYRLSAGSYIESRKMLLMR